MRVAMYYNNSDVRVQEMPRPKIDKGEILVRVIASGICGSDVLEWYRVKKAPLVLGHEIAGDVVEAADDVTKYKVGDRVFVSHHVPCNTCYYCLNGHHTACETLHTTNYFPGGFSEYIKVPKLNVDRGVFILPKEVTYEEGAFIEPLACVVRGQRSAGFKPGETVLILGSGVSGLLHLLLARATGAGKILMTDISDFKLKKAMELGADACIRADANVPQAVLDINENRFADLVIVSTGALSAYEQAMQSVDKGGTILCFATTPPNVDIKIPINRFWRNDIKIMPSYGNSPYDAEIAIELLREKRVPVTKMITHRLSLEEAAKGFKLAAESKEAIKVILEPHKKTAARMEGKSGKNI